MKFYIFLLITLQILITDISLSQSFYRSVADVDSFAYVTMDDKILILKRDEANELKFVDSISFEMTNRSDNLNSAIVINDYLLVSSKDSVVLFSISDRENPFELHRINVGSIIRINKFGDYCFVYTSSNSQLLGIENDSLKLLTTHYRSISGSTYFFYNNMSLNFPFVLYKRYGSDSKLILEKFNSVDNSFVIKDSVSPSQPYYFDGLISNSKVILAIETTYGNGFIQDWFRYYIVGDSITNRTRLCNWETGEYPRPVEGFQLNDNYGIGYFGNPAGFSFINSINPCSTIPFNINANPYNHDFIIGNYIYRISSEGLYYQYQNGTFHKFQFPPVSVENNNKPNNYLLSQNYPNPFNPTTRIQYAVSSRELVTLKVYDVLGREVATLVNEEKQPGVYEVEFNTNELTSGIYFYRIQTDGFSSTKKMILLK